MKRYEVVIGLEVHVELSTKTKMFCFCSTEFGGEPNTQCCPVCTGMPGSLPVINKQAVEYAIAAGLALNCDITQQCRFDRKNYFYPDLPKAYQISQLYQPIGRNGGITIDTELGKKTIGIHEIHMEEDAGKLTHIEDGNYTLVDYNRCGIPLIEIVSEPDMHSAKEAIAYLEKLKQILKYLGVSDCKMQEGSLRADINLSVREVGAKELGTRTEMKNMNSFKAIARAIEGEKKRQIALLEKGEPVIRETRRWDDERNASFAMRSKEDARDYRYFPEPDLPPLIISDEWIDDIRNRQPELGDEKMLRFEKEFGIPAYDAKIITSDKYLAQFFEETVAICGRPKEVSNWLMVEVMRLLKEEDIEAEEISFTPVQLAKLIEMIEAGKINRTVAKEVFEHVFKENVDPDEYVIEHGLSMVSDDGVLQSIIEKVIAENRQSVEDYRNGKTKAFGYLVGQTMKETKGKADPKMVNQMIKKILDQ
ncbi:MAG: Asp-tRNA(Asn)/Glu-tRNA(Gln) amidotransferase subunit GatB [Clostridiales bacterium]|nr:Asp-tRNA(Asn)/Glu-tRNA(Gln) amidotransferase subunit GatB [Clostridiales bacterium]